MRFPLLCLATSAVLLAGTAHGSAQTAPAPGQPAPAQASPGQASPGQASPNQPSAGATPPAAAPNPVVARVGGEEIYQSDLTDAAQQLPDELRGVPPTVLYPMLLDQLVDRKVIALAARRAGLDQDPQIRRQMQRAADQVLQTALLQREVGPKLTEQAIRARYDRTVANKPGEEEVHARHILVADEAEAKRITDELSKGADFAELAKKYSTDPSARAGGGDLGWFKRGDMVTEFSDAAFGLKPGEVTRQPVKTRFGWHIIKLEGRRTAPPEPFEEARNEIRQEMIQEEVKAILDRARAATPIERFNPDGSPRRATDAAEPPPAPANPR